MGARGAVLEGTVGITGDTSYAVISFAEMGLKVSLGLYLDCCQAKCLPCDPETHRFSRQGKVHSFTLRLELGYTETMDEVKD